MYIIKNDGQLNSPTIAHLTNKDVVHPSLICDLPTNGLFYSHFFHYNSNLLDVLFYHNSISGYDIAINCRTCHDSIAVLTCAKIYSNQFIKISMRVKQKL